jgi:hypothetical protein
MPVQNVCESKGETLLSESMLQGDDYNFNKLLNVELLLTGIQHIPDVLGDGNSMEKVC